MLYILVLLYLPCPCVRNIMKTELYYIGVDKRLELCHGCIHMESEDQQAYCNLDCCHPVGLNVAIAAAAPSETDE